MGFLILGPSSGNTASGKETLVFVMFPEKYLSQFLYVISEVHGPPETIFIHI